MSAIRLARGVTGRDLVVKFAGCYHGHVDSLLAEAGSGVATLAVPGTRGVPASVGRPRRSCCPTTTAPPSRRPSPTHGDRIACLITEASPGNMGVVPPAPGFNALPRRDLPRPRRAVHQRRGDDRLPRDRAGRLGPRRRRRGLDARPDDLRQGDGRRLPGRGLRRSRRRDGRSSRPRGPSTRPARSRGTRSPRPPASPRSGSRRPRSTPHLDATARDDHAPPWPRRSTAAGVPARRPDRRHHVLGVLPRRRGRATSPGASQQDTGAFAAFFHAMLDAGRLPAAVGVRGVVRLRRPTTTAPSPPSSTPCPRAAPRPPRREVTDMGVQTIVHLLRHGEVHNPEGVLYGRRDGFHLSDLGHQMAAADRARRSATATSSTCVRRRSSVRRRPPRRWPPARGLDAASSTRG